MKKKPTIKQNTFKRLSVDSNGRLIDATKDVTEKDLVQDQYRKLKENQFSAVPQLETRNTLVAYLFSLSILILFFTFVYLLLKHIA